MGEFEERVGRRIRAAREGAGLKQEEVAERLGLSAVGYGAYERGDRQIPIDTLVALGRVLGRSVTYLLDQPSDVGLTPEEVDCLEGLRSIGNDGIRQVIMRMVKAGARPAP